MGYWLINTAGIGSIVVVVVGLSVLIAYTYMVRWIQTAPPDSVSVEAGRPGEELTAAEAGGEEA